MKKVIAIFTDGTKYSFNEESDVFKIDDRANKIAKNFKKTLAYWEFV